jgi:3-hydroxyisobutyrate dehydrogenase-like beta-hydroxyacid dehydrogenase
VRETPSQVAEECDLTISCVPDVPQVEEVLFAPGGIQSSGKRGLLHVDMSTINPTAARSFNRRLAEVGIENLDAPVSGGPTRAADGSLTIMVGGSVENYERAKPILEVLGQHVIHVGEAGSGQAVKLVNQLMISIIMIANAEALSLGVKAGVPLETLTQVIGTSSGSNYLMQNWLPRTLFSGNLESGFALDLLMKDLNAALQWAGELQLPAFGGVLAQQLYRIAKLEGAGRLDYSAVARFYERAAGIQLRLSEQTGE